jgi:hypothetical protein
MRKFALIAAAMAFAALSIAFAAARGTAAPPKSKHGLGDALARTAHVSSLHYAFRVGIRENGRPLALHIRGQSDANTISVHLATAGMSAAELLDGPFLYEQAPNGMVVNGKWRWLRIEVKRLRPGSSAIAVVHALTPTPLLRVIAEGRMRGTGRLYRGEVAYDDPIVRTALARLTGGIEFRQLQLVVHVGRDGLIHGLRLTGKTADRSSTFELVGRLFAFNRPVHVSPPKPGTFMDAQLVQLGA